MIVTADPDCWSRCYESPLAQRSGRAPVELVAHLARVGACAPAVMQGMVPVGFLDDLARAVAQMPALLRHWMDGECLGVYCVRGLGSSAASDVVVQPDGRLLGVVVAVDVEHIVDGSANEWASWRAATPFRADTEWSLRMTIAAPGADDRCAALQYLLLHEFGHVLSARRPLVPPWWIAWAHLRREADYGFLPLSWLRNADGAIVPLPHNDFPLRQRLAFYGEAPLQADDMLPVYLALQQTSFATLYAAQNVYDDFAETFASYVHVVLMDKPHEVELCQHGRAVLRLDPYWDSRRSMRKRHCLQQLLTS